MQIDSPCLPVKKMGKTSVFVDSLTGLASALAAALGRRR
jgi:hypothetical protein